jgi:Fe-S oxidoreductase
VDLVPVVIDDEALWACTTCRACETICPVVVEHVPRLVDIRRDQVMMKGDFPPEALTAFKGMEDNYNPWNLNWSERQTWARGLDVPTLSEKGSTPLLLWTGCSGAYDKRNMKVVQALVSILKEAKVEFAILGNEEKCCGDSARRMGHELLFQTLAEANVETFGRYGVKRIVCTCPHCFNTLANEYYQLGGEFEVVHHGDLIRSLIEEGQIAMPARDKRTGSWAYHDPCYLGRYNNIYDPPRESLERATGGKVTELAGHRNRSTCCGGGGGRMWLEEEKGKELINLRVEDVSRAGVDAVATACPFCLTMLSDGLSEMDNIAVSDVAEVVAAAMDLDKDTN